MITSLFPSGSSNGNQLRIVAVQKYKVSMWFNSLSLNLSCDIMQMQDKKQQNDEITNLISQILDKKISLAINAFNKVDENTTRFLNSSLTYTYYILSITAASAAFVISLTIHEKIRGFDLLILVSLIVWIISFIKGLQKVTRTMKIMNSFSYFVLGEASKSKEISEPHKKVIDQLGSENEVLINQPLFYFLLGSLFFIIWYLIKIFVTLSL